MVGLQDSRHLFRPGPLSFLQPPFQTFEQDSIGRLNLTIRLRMLHRGNPNRSNVTNGLSAVNPWKIITLWRFFEIPVIPNDFETRVILDDFETPVISDSFETPGIPEGFETPVIPGGFRTPLL